MTRRRSQSFAAIAMVAMNAGMYGFTIVSARVAGRAQFGAITALLGVLLVANVVALGLQAATARRVAVAIPADRPEAAAGAIRVAVVVASAVGAVTAASTVALTPALRLDSAVPVLLCGAAMVPLTLFGALCGIAQGGSRWNSLAVILLAHGLGRLVASTIFLVAHPTAGGAMLGVAVGSWVPVVAGGWLLQPGIGRFDRRLAAESLTSAWALLAFFILTSADALLARHLLAAHLAGLYAAGLIMVKTASFLPQFVGLVLFPRLARDRSHRSRLLATGSVAVIGSVVVVGTALLPGLALVLVGGHTYADIGDRLWLFALSGSLQAVLYVLVFDSIARRGRGTTTVLWIAICAVLATALSLDVGITALVTVMAVAALLAAAAVLALPALSGGRRPAG